MTVESDLLVVKGCPTRTEAGARFIETFRALQQQTCKIMPPRKALTLSVARPFVSYMSILEVFGPMNAVFRIMGTGHVNRTRVDNTGKNWFDLAEPSSHEQHWQHFQRILGTPCGCIGHYLEKYDKALVVEAINLPFADNEGRARFIVSTNVQLRLEDLLLRGEALMVPGEVEPLSYLDIGAGTGS